MNSINVDTSCLYGFSLDLLDIAACANTNLSQLSPLISFPPGTSEIGGGLTSSFDRFAEEYTRCAHNDFAAIEVLGNDLSTVAALFRSSDRNNATYIAAAGEISASDDSPGLTRYGGLQFPTLNQNIDTQCSIQELIESTITTLTPYDKGLATTLGVNPTVEYLTPFSADWELLNEVGSRIERLGINDFVTAQNLTSGADWLRSQWSGTAATSFIAKLLELSNSSSDRSIYMEATSKIICAAGKCLEQLARNQAADLIERVLQTIKHDIFEFPLGAWAGDTGVPLPTELEVQITAETAALQQSASGRRGTLFTLAEAISEALDYYPTRTSPTYNPAEFDIPTVITVDPGNRRYGIAETVWWTESIHT
ncbi:hypothetical protein FEK33_12425 [Nocardia asteroides NBRC 15531]|uniref:Uncharacterized protein n=1 Tax=Nocardia asteroides NBRC 15531 TaxID=1110697 RepID=U5EFX0_NOCAS|nr:hypothetical protein [Nocardia asteroides]TLF66830.1 hypothetical protein FEK33_12425 [Nocardia asteroides NBRC 15531]UGT51925.1 hypothetical protein LT345_15780 [Nocardia asteroides]SFN02209.1 hypothetical protein SAMN05444423_105388 [Nocardia asteroides]VEG35160.1 Uncharacterised protein [Nocardia asteroides]GAD85291.1 hypothetical protein NCAST_30_00610 [Nocardia asteroides NBRC 15531]